MNTKEKRPTYDEKSVRDISVAVYEAQLGPDDTARMIEKDKDEGQKLRSRAAAYDSLTRAYLDVLNKRGLILRAVNDAH